MKIHLITIGEPKFPYAKAGWGEYLKRLRHYHQVRVTHIDNKWAYDTKYILAQVQQSYKIALTIAGKAFSSQELATFLEGRAMDGREASFIIGGPEGLPKAVIDQCDLEWSFSKLTFPHDLAMVILVEALYRASTIAAGQPYHK